jgi:SAM-dependent methyltransferase
MNDGSKKDILSDVAGYYSGKLAAHGETPRGVDWNSEEGQKNRFQQLLKIIDISRPVSINDLGCGYGALYEFMKSDFEIASYTGCDVSEKMIEAARARQSAPEAHFVVSSEPPGIADYGIASGIFNVSLGHTKEAWGKYLEDTLEVLDRTSRLGFAFNCLTSYSDREFMREDLYYADPVALFDLCKRRFARNVALLHDYDLYEFTILVRKQP